MRHQHRVGRSQPRLGVTPLQLRILRAVCYHYTEKGAWPSPMDIAGELKEAFGTVRHAATLLRKQGLLLQVIGKDRHWYQLTPESYRMVTGRDPEQEFVCA